MSKLHYIIYRVGYKFFSIFRHQIPNYFQSKSFMHFGSGSSLGCYNRILGHRNISIGDHTNVGAYATLYALKAPLTIGNGVMFGSHVSIITGNHRTDVVGEYMYRIDDSMKKPENDQPVVIEDDVWLGAGCTILKGSTVGHGSIIHAGAVVSGTVPPYSVYFSRDAIKPRFTPEQIQEHERLLKEKYGKVYSE